MDAAPSKLVLWFEHTVSDTQFSCISRVGLWREDLQASVEDQQFCPYHEMMELQHLAKSTAFLVGRKHKKELLSILKTLHRKLFSFSKET